MIETRQDNARQGTPQQRPSNGISASVYAFDLFDVFTAMCTTRDRLWLEVHRL